MSETKPAERTNMDISGKPLPKPMGERFLLRGMRLQTRLVLLTLLISIPVILLSVGFLTLRGEALLRQYTNEQLAKMNSAILLKTDTWFKMNVGLLHQMAAFDDIASMDPARQKPLLVNTNKAFPNLFLVQTINTNGMNVARNDDQANKDYSDREYFQGAMTGAEVAYQVLISRTTNQPALNLASPIRDKTGKIIGVMSIVSELKDITKDVLGTGANGQTNTPVTFIVDGTNKVIAHPDQETATKLTDYSTYPPVVALRQGYQGVYEFTDAQNQHWLAYLGQMDNGWGVITQQEYAVAFAEVRRFELVSAIIIIIAAVLLVALSLLIIRRSFRSMEHLNETVMAVTAGDLSRIANVERADEVGQLAQAFNLLTARLRENIATLEQRVQDRTRAMMLSTDVSRRVSTILNMDQLTREVVNEVQHTFNYYHVHIYLFDETGQNLVMAGGTGEAGQVMMARKHHIPAGRGLVGRAAAKNEAVLVSDTTEDPGWLPNPLLPETKSELAVPIATNDRVLGVLDVQQNTENGLTEMDVDLIRLTANQVAIALQNAMVYAQAQQKAERETLVASLGQKIQQAATIDDVLKVTIRELGQALGAQRSSVELRSDAAALDRKD